MTTIKQLHHFLVLAEKLHFAKAAEELGITQATLSNEIKKLETVLGFQLFDRSNKWEISLTAPGASYLQHVREIPAMLHFARENAREIARGESGILSIAISSFIYDFFNLGEVCRKMRLQYPGVTLKIYDTLRSPLVAECIRQGKADVGFFMVSRPAEQTAGLRYKKLLPNRMKLAMSRNHPLAEKDHISVNDLKNCHFILPPREESPMLRRKLDEIFMKECQQIPVVPLEVLGFSGVKQLAAAGHGIGFLPERATNLPPALVMREAPFELSSFLIAACDENNNSPVVRNFMSLLNVAE